MLHDARKRCVIVTLVLVGAIPWAQGGQTGSIDTIGQMDGPDRQALVVSIVQNRDAQLQNFAYEATWDTFSFTPSTGERTLVYGDSFAVKRDGQRLFFHGERATEAGLHDFNASWDGSMKRSLSYRPYRENAQYSGVISDQEDNNIKDHAYNHILGLRLLGTYGLYTLPEWLDTSIQRGSLIDVTVVEEAGRPMISLKITAGYESSLWVLDPDRDYMPVRAEVRYEHGEVYDFDVSTVEEALEVDGLWVPTRVVQRTGYSLDERQNECIFEVSTFSRNTVTDADFEIEFPPGTEVINRVAKRAYRVLEGGGVEMMPLFDSDTRETIQPADMSIEGALEDLEMNLEASARVASSDGNEGAESQVSSGDQPLQAMTEPVDSTRRWGPGVITAGIGGILLCIGAVWLLTRRTKAEAEGQAGSGGA